MAGVAHEDTVSLAQAARILGVELDQLVWDVFALRVRTVAAPSGRRVVPWEEIDRLRGTSPEPSPAS